MPDVSSLVERLRGGDRRAVARLISMVEDGYAGEVMREIHPYTGQAMSVGITGPPGAGKSTLSDQLIGCARREDRSVGVIAVDPTSPFSGGALLGDRVRMGDHALDPKVFIRSMATRGHLGGLAVAVPEAMRVLEAAGAQLVIVETVGVGQSEVDVAAQADTTIVVLTPDMGDAVQAAKAGILEVADVFCLNKADREGVRQASRDLRGMLDLGSVREKDWVPPIVLTTASAGEGVDDLWDAVRSHQAWLVKSGRLASRRRERTADEIRGIVQERLKQVVLNARLDLVLDDVIERRLDPGAAAERLLEDYL